MSQLPLANLMGHERVCACVCQAGSKERLVTSVGPGLDPSLYLLAAATEEGEVFIPRPPYSTELPTQGIKEATTRV